MCYFPKVKEHEWITVSQLSLGTGDVTMRPLPTNKTPKSSDDLQSALENLFLNPRKQGFGSTPQNVYSIKLSWNLQYVCECAKEGLEQSVADPLLRYNKAPTTHPSTYTHTNTAPNTQANVQTHPCPSKGTTISPHTLNRYHTTLPPDNPTSTERIAHDHTNRHIIPTQVPRHGLIHSRIRHRQASRSQIHRHGRHSLHHLQSPVYPIHALTQERQLIGSRTHEGVSCYIHSINGQLLRSQHTYGTSHELSHTHMLHTQHD